MALSSSAWRQVLDRLPIGVIVVDADGLMVYFNETAADLTGLDESELREAVAGRSERLLAALESGRLHLVHLRQHNDLARIRRRMLAQAAVLSTLSRDLEAGVSDVGRVLDQVVGELSALEGELCLISLLDESHTRVAVGRAAHPDPEAAEYFTRLAQHAPPPSPEPLLLPGVPGAELPGLLAQHVEVSLPQLAGTEAQLMIVPLRHQGGVFGTLALAGWAQDAPYTPADLDWLGAVADLTTLAVVNARLHAEAADRFGALEAARRVDLAIASSVDQMLTLDVILDQFLVHLGVDAAAILVPDGGDGLLRMASSAGLGAAPRTNLRSEEGPYAGAFASGGPVLIRPPELRPWLAQVGLGGESFQAADVVPLLVYGESVGLLELFRRRSETEHSAEQRQAIEALALRAGLTVLAWRERRLAGGGGTPSDRDLRELSRAQIAVLRLLAEGASNRAIARELHISENTVKSHLREVFRKLGATSRLQAAMRGAAWLRSEPAAGGF